MPTNNTNTRRISRKTYAAIKTANDDMNAILALAATLTEENALETAKKMAEYATKYISDFADVDPAWTPNKAAQAAEKVVETITAE